MTETEFRVTLGVQYAREPHPTYPAAHPDGWIAVLAVDELAARRALSGALGGAYSSIYHPDDDYYPTTDRDQYSPLGEIGRLRVLPDLNGTPAWTWLRRVETGEWMPRPTVWAFRNAYFGDRGDQVWMAITDDGEPIASHVSSSRDWGRHDVGPTGFYRARYIEMLGTDEVDYRVLDDGEIPPQHVRDANAALAAAAKGTGTEEG